MSDDAAPKMGRPTEYRDEFCDAVVDHMREGKSLTAFAAEIGHARSSINEWMAAHPDFSEAVARGKALCAAWWEERARDSAKDGKGNATLIVFGLKNMGADDWADTSKIDHSSKDGTMSPHGSSADAALDAMRRKHGAAEGDA